MTKSKINLLQRNDRPIIGYYELFIFCFLIFEFIALTSSSTLKSETFVTTHYLLTYEFGFTSRALVGSIVSFFTDHLTYRMIFNTGVISYLILISEIALLLGYIIRKSKPVERSAIIIFVALFLASPLSVTYLLGFHFARLDTYWIIITLLALFFLKRKFLIWTVPLLCAAAVCVHHGYMVTYMPALAIPMLYEIYKHNGSKKSIAIFTSSCIAMIALFAFFQFYPTNIPFNSAAEFAEYLTKNAGFPADASMLYLEYYAPFYEWFSECILPLTATYALPLSIVLFTFSLPLIIIFGKTWAYCIKNTKDRFLKFIFILSSIAPIAFLFAAVFGNDWDRWWAAAVNTQFILVFYFVCSNEASIVAYLKKIAHFFQEHSLLLLLIIVFTNSLTFSHTSSLLFTYIFNPDAYYGIFNKYFIKNIYGMARPLFHHFS